MYPFMRLAKTIVTGAVGKSKGQSLDITDTSEIKVSTNLTDIDHFLEMNNGRILTLFDLGRTDLAIRTGLGKKLLQNRWGLVVAGSTIQYRKRVFIFNKITIKTRIVGIDEKWIYIEQSMWSKGQTTSVALFRTGITNFATGKVIPTKQVFAAIGKKEFDLPPEPWVQAWIDADKLRPIPTTDKPTDTAQKSETLA